jgi:hypothetical protein
MEALVKLSESLPEGLSEIQKENLEELVEVLEHIERSGQQIIPALLSTRLGVDGARIRQNVGTDDLAPEDIEPGDIYVPGETIAKSGDGVVVVPLFGVKGNLRWLMGDRLPDCFSHNATNNGVTGSACADCPDLPFRDGEMTDCALVWHWVFLTEGKERQDGLQPQPPRPSSRYEEGPPVHRVREEQEGQLLRLEVLHARRPP